MVHTEPKESTIARVYQTTRVQIPTQPVVKEFVSVQQTITGDKIYVVRFC